MKKILVGVDGSPRAPLVLQYAADLAAQVNGKLTVVRVVTLPVELPPEAMTLSPNRLPDLLLDAARKDLHRLVAQIPPERLERSEVHLGTPWQVLCDIARNEASDLIVIGTHGYTALDRLIGTTAARVVNHAPCSVLVVRTGGSQ